MRSPPVYTAEDATAKLERLGRTNVEVVSFAGKATLRSQWRCKTCATEWEARALNIFSGHGCPTCASRTLSAKAFAREARHREARV